MDIDNITNINNIIINTKIIKYPFNPIFFILSTEISFAMFLKHKGYLFISESFALNGCVFVALTNKKLLLPL